MSSDIKRSISLYSYQDEYYDHKLDLEGCLQEAAKTGAAGVELLAEQMIKRFPDQVVEDQFLEKWFGWLKKYNLTPTCYDAFMENHIFDNRQLSLPEEIKMMERDLRLAHTLGFKTLRTLASTPLDVIEGSLDYAEKMDVKIGLEVHAPFCLSSSWGDYYKDMIHRTGSKYFGFIPDLSIFCRRIPDVVADHARRMGAHEECIRIVDEDYQDRFARGFVKLEYSQNLGDANMTYRRANGLEQLTEKVKKAGGNDADLYYVSMSYTYTWNDPKDLIDNIPYIVHTHAKFYNMHEDFKDTAVDIDAVVDAYKKAGYTGYMSSEYEGGEQLRDALPVDSITQVARNQEALRRAIER